MPRLRRRDLLAMRLFILAAYTVAAALVAWTGRDSAWWWVLHFTGALAGLCAGWMAPASVPQAGGTPDREGRTSGEDGGRRGRGRRSWRAGPRAFRGPGGRRGRWTRLGPRPTGGGGSRRRERGLRPG